MVASSGSVTQVNASGDAEIDGILWGWRWNTNALNYTFPNAATAYTNNGYVAVNGFSAFNGSQVQAVLQAVTNVMNFANLQFSLVDPATTTSPTLRFAEASSVNYSNSSSVTTKPGLRNIDTAEANPPELGFNGNAPYAPSYAQGDAWFNPSNYNSPTPGSFQFSAGILHEFGHNLGLKHGHDTQSGHGITFPVLPSDHDSYEFSVMTYRQFPGDDLANPGFDNAPDHPTTFMMNDIAALQYLYGANYGDFSNNTDTVYTWNPVNGELSVNGAQQGAPVNNHVFMTVWDGGGNDTYNFASYTSDINVNLAPGSWTSLGTAYRPDLGNDGPGTVEHYARGNVFNARLFQNNLASIIENALGGSGNDTIAGNQVDNVLQGLGGNDSILGLDGNDVLAGDDGNDELKGGGGADGLYGGNNNDTLKGGGGADILNGGPGIDWINYTGSDAGVIINMPAGTGAGGHAAGDTLLNVENIIGSDYVDNFIGDPGNNTFRGGDGGDIMDGGAGFDTADYSDSSVAVVIDLAAGTGSGGTAEGDRLFGIERITGSNFDDTVSGNAIANELAGGAGNDSLSGLEGNDRLLGQAGLDTLNGDLGNDTLLGGSENDLLKGGGGADVISGGSENDQGIGGSGDDTVRGGNGDDLLYGRSGDDRLLGNGNDDFLNGAAGDDTLVGGSGNDTLFGSGGRDLLQGNAGDDTFLFTALGNSLPGPEADRVRDFTQGNDLIDLSHIDAVKGGGDDAFVFIGTAAFSDTSGELRQFTSGNSTIVVGDVNGDGVADFKFVIQDLVVLDNGDFIL